MPSSKTFILGIDTSCDDTSIAVLESASREVRSNIISSQIKIHAVHGGVVPEIASRSHLENISLVMEAAMTKANINAHQIGAVAVTNKPGLIGCLLVGTSFARALAYKLKVPLYAVNHLTAHLFSPFIGVKPVFPALGLVVSGGHTSFYAINSFTDVKVIGQTVDDAAGEAFDKSAKMMGLGYPGGPVVSQLAAQGDAAKYAFTRARVKMGEEYLSFSGLKTAVHNHLMTMGSLTQESKQNLCASLQKAIVDALCAKIIYFFKNNSFKAFALSGGVALNSLLRERSTAICAEQNIKSYMAAKEFCSDNGAMIAHAALVAPSPNMLFDLEVNASKKIQARKLKATI